MWFRNDQSASSTSTTPASISATPNNAAVFKSASTASTCSLGPIFSSNSASCSTTSISLSTPASSCAPSSSCTTGAVTSSSATTPSQSNQYPKAILLSIFHKTKPNNNHILRLSNAYRSRPFVVYTLLAILATSLLYCLLLYNSAVHDSNLQTIASRHYAKAEDIHKRHVIQSPDKLIENGRVFLQKFQTFTNKNFRKFFQNNDSFVPSDWERIDHKNITNHLFMLKNNSDKIQDKNSRRKKFHTNSRNAENVSKFSIAPEGDQNKKYNNNDNNQTKVFEDAVSSIFDVQSANEHYLERLGFNIRYICEKLLQFNQTNPDNITEIGDILKSAYFLSIFNSKEFSNELLLQKAIFNHDLFDDDDKDDDDDASMGRASSDENEREALKRNDKRQQTFNSHLNLLLRPDLFEKQQRRQQQQFQEQLRNVPQRFRWNYPHNILQDDGETYQQNISPPKQVITLKKDEEFVLFLSALDSKQFNHGIRLIESFKNFLTDDYYQFNSDKTKKILSTLVIFDIGLEDEQFAQIQLLCNGTTTITRPSTPLSPSSSLSSSFSSSSFSSSFDSRERQKSIPARPLCLILPFSFDKYPSHLSNLKSGAYRSILIQETLRDLREHLNNPTAYNIIWLDPHYRILSSKSNIATGSKGESLTVKNTLLGTMLDNCRNRSGICSWSIELPTSSLTHPKLFQHFHTNAENYYFHRMITTGALVISFSDRQWQAFEWGIMLPWVSCALDSNCIEPLGSQWRLLCQSDKRPYFRFTGCHHYDMSVLNVLLGMAFKYSSRQYSLDSINSTHSQLFVPFFKLNSSSDWKNGYPEQVPSTTTELSSNLDQVFEYESFTRFDKQFTDSELSINDNILITSGNS